MDFTLSEAQQLQTSKGHPFGLKGLTNYLPVPFHSQKWLGGFYSVRDPTIFPIEGGTFWSERIKLYAKLKNTKFKNTSNLTITDITDFLSDNNTHQHQQERRHHHQQRRKYIYWF